MSNFLWTSFSGFVINFVIGRWPQKWNSRLFRTYSSLLFWYHICCSECFHAWLPRKEWKRPCAPPPPKKKGTVDFLGLCSDRQLSFSPCWIEHLFLIIITPRSSNLVENFLFYEWFLMDCHFRDLPLIWHRATVTELWKSGKSRKWQSIRNYS